jgi:hypothetical protein
VGSGRVGDLPAPALSTQGSDRGFILVSIQAFTPALDFTLALAFALASGFAPGSYIQASSPAIHSSLDRFLEASSCHRALS